MVYPGGPALLLLFRNNNAGTYYAVVGVGATSSYIACVFDESDDIIVITISKANAVITASLNSTAVSANSENHVTYNTSFTVTALLNGNSSTNLSIKYTGTNGTSYAESTDKPINAGTYNVSISFAGDNNYNSASFSFTLIIDQLDISSANVEIEGINSSYVFTGSPITPAPTKVSVNGIEITSYDLSYTNNTNIGTATLIITGKDNYIGTYNINFDISDIIDLASATILLSKSSFYYTGSEHKPTATVKVGTTVLTEGTDYTVAYYNNINYGTATVTITATENSILYTGSTSVSFLIFKRQLTPQMSSVDNIIN